MGGIAIDIWEKSNLFGSMSIGSQKGANNITFLQGGRLKFKAPPLPLGGLKK